jgi:hypothetical protein
MSLLERFGIVFDSNAADTTKENEKLAKSLDKVDDAAQKATKATEKENKTINEGNKSLDKKAVTLNTLTRRFLGLGAAMKIVGSTLATLGVTTAVGRFASDLGLDVERLETLVQTAKRFGGDANTSRASIGGLALALEGIEIGENLDIFKKLGFAGASVFDESGEKKGVFDIIDEIGVFLRSLEDPAKALQLGLNAGLDVGIIRTLLQPNIEEELATTQGLGVTTPEQVQQATELSEAWAKLMQLVDTLAREFMTNIAPWVTGWINNTIKTIQLLQSLGDFNFRDWFSDFFSSIKTTFIEGLGDLNLGDLLSDFFSFKNLTPTQEKMDENAEIIRKTKEGTLEQEGFGPETAPQWIQDLFNFFRRNEEKNKRIVNEALEGNASARTNRKEASAGGIPLSPNAANAAIHNNNQTASNTVSIDQINIDAGGNANSTEIASNVGDRIMDIANVNAQFSGGVIA